MIRPRVFRMGRVIPRSRLRPLGPVGLLGAVAAGIALAFAAVFTLGLALLLKPRVRPGRPAPDEGPRPGGATPRGDGAGTVGAANGSRRERSYAEIVEALPIAVALALGLSLGGAAV